MPALDVENPGVPVVAAVRLLLQQLLDEASTAKDTAAIEPALSASDFEDITGQVAVAVSSAENTEQDENSITSESTKIRRFGVIETAARDLFGKLIATTPIDSPDFVKMWNLFDILSILSDDGQCDPALLFWLVEELLDSQTISGCRKIFDYLESRRERITAKHFKQKNLVILRSCNELLRRLSRAEDTAFCGRVFIFLFQSFPLGDRSSVNLRGEFHVENITDYEQAIPRDASTMDVDSPADTPKETGEAKAIPKGVSFDSKTPGKPMEPSSLYPLFWSLQESFSQPMRLFDSANFSKFKTSLEATIKVFQTIHKDEGSQSSRALENSKRILKRKREEEGQDEAPATFNPKYLTSIDLFELEISDLSFRRHVLVQALITTDFLLSLSAGAREKWASISASNKSVIYPDQLDEENTKWAVQMKKDISDYLKQGFDGPYFYRMVETVLARDKNWVFWKMAGCPPIEKESISPAIFVEAKSAAQRMATSKRLRPVPLGSVSMDFLKSEDDSSAMADLKSAERYQLPELDSFKSKIADDDFDIDMASSEQAKAAAIAGKASKSWRALRIAARSKLAAFDKIDDPKKVDVAFEEMTEGDDDEGGSEVAAPEEDMPQNRDPIIISGPAGVGKSTLLKKLLEHRRGVFAPVVRHTNREPRDEEVKGKDYHFVTTQEFNQLRDGDRLVEYGSRDDSEYGTSAKAIDTITEAGKVPVIELDLEAAQFAKDMDFSARYVFLRPPNDDSLRERLLKSGHDEAETQSVLDKLSEALDLSKAPELFNTSFENDELDDAVAALESYIFENKQGDEDDDSDGDSSMDDAPTDQSQEETNGDDDHV